MIEFDCETTGLQPYSADDEAFLWIFSSEPNGADAEYIEFRATQWWMLDNYEPDEQEEILAAHGRIQEWFERAKTEGIRAWNTKFDRGFAEQAGCFDLPDDGMWHDGMIVAQAMDERRSVALKAVSSQLFGEEAAAPQKSVKQWLNEENNRRRKVVTDAKKIDDAIAKLADRFERKLAQADKAKKEETRNKYRGDAAAFALQMEELERSKPALVAEAATYYREDGTFVYANYSDVPLDTIMGPYALEDVILTRKVSDVYQARLNQMPDIRNLVEFERKAMDALYGVEKRGLPARDHEYRKLEQEVIDNLTIKEDRVHELVMEADPIVYAKELAGDKWGEGGKFIEVSEDGIVTSYRGGAASLEDFSANSSAHILAALKARGADMSFMSEKDGKVSADKDNLQAVDDELAAAILEYRSEYKVLSTYVRPMIGRSYESSLNTYKSPFIAPDSRIHANYRQVGARTGRMSCSDPNMQNQPRDDLRLRYNIVADPEYVLITCDLTNIEMYLFAAYCGEGLLLDAVQRGEDLHTLTAKMLGLRDRKRPGGGIETARQLGKTYNFSRVYGGGLRTIRRQFRCSMQEARLLKKRFDDAYPEVHRLTMRIRHGLEDNGYIQDKLISGRRFRVDPRDDYKATNYLVQGTAAALLKDAMIKLHALGVPMVALVHDEIVAHVHKSEALEISALIEEKMISAAQPGGQLWLPEEKKIINGQEIVIPAHPVVPLRAEAEIVKRWSDAKRLKNDDGSEYLFEPEWAGGNRRPVPTVEEVLAAA